MAKFSATFRCGHIESVNIYGAQKDRLHKLGSIQDSACPACRAASVSAERAKATAVAAAATSEMPALSGSDKQIAWATTIRAEIMTDINNQRDKISTVIEPTYAGNPAAEIAITVARKAFDQVAAQTAATWWINNRQMGRCTAFEFADGNKGAEQLIRMTIKA